MPVQIGNNWIKKIPLTAKLDSACGLTPILAVLGIFFIQLFLNWTACSPITYTNEQRKDEHNWPKRRTNRGYDNYKGILV